MTHFHSIRHHADPGLFVRTDEQTFFQVNQTAYTCRETWLRELETIFDTCWLYACHKSEIKEANNFLTRQVGGRPVLLTRDDKGEVRAFLNACSHRGAVVCQQERGTAKKFMCPYHGWCYNQEGRLTSMPGRDAYGPDQTMDQHAMPSLALEEYRGFYFLCFSPPKQSLSDYLGEARDYIDLIADQSLADLEIIPGTHRHAMKANWKLLAENGVDAYHLPVAHKRFLDWISDQGTSELSHKRTGVGLDLGNGHAVIKSGPPSTGRPIAHWSPLFGEDMKPVIEERWQQLKGRIGEERAYDMAKTNRSLFLFPNTVFNDILGLNIRTFFPAAPDQVNITVWGAGFSDETPSEREARVSGLISFIGPSGFGTPDDVEIIESCQRAYAHRGMGWSDFSRGMGSNTQRHTDEAQNRAFWRAWLAAISNTRAYTSPHLAERERDMASGTEHLER